MSYGPFCSDCTLYSIDCNIFEQTKMHVCMYACICITGIHCAAADGGGGGGTSDSVAVRLQDLVAARHLSRLRHKQVRLTYVTRATCGRIR